ncbi:MAG: SDR family oxidoreductase [Candidatus Schekmanbacteria bacterium]|nr:SDR family oxidoreductase [Candidatus Schekmanbacteria bacterium]
MAVYLVTGGGGFIGSHLVAHLVATGHQVKVIDNFATGHRENLAPCLSEIELFVEDIRNLAALRPIVQNVDYILHQAALPSVARSVLDPISSHQVNTTGTLNLLIAAQEAQVKRFVLASSSSVYGANLELPKRETMPYLPLSPYATNKATAEMYCRNFHHLYGLPVVCLRYFNVFGPRQDPTSQYAAVIPKFIRALLQNESPSIYGDGEQSRDFTYVDNVVEANLLAAIMPGAVGQIFNIGCGERTSLNQLLEILQNLTGNHCKANYTDPRPGDVKHSLADISRAESLLGFKPKIKLEEGLARTVKYWQGK